MRGNRQLPVLPAAAHSAIRSCALHLFQNDISRITQLRSEAPTERLWSNVAVCRCVEKRVEDKAIGRRAGHRRKGGHPLFLVMTLLVRDEEETLEANMRYHLDQGIDHIIVTDNLSSDRSREIIQDFVSQGVATYLFEGEDTHAQSRWVTRMARMAHETFQADWIVHSDADEFWIPLAHPSLAAFFSQCQEWDVIEAQRHDFVCVRDETADNRSLPFWARMTYRKTVSLNPLGNPLLPKVAHRPSANAVVADGNHAVSGLDTPRKLQGGLEILHFPLRSRSQYINKIRVGGKALMNNTGLPLNVGATWRRQYDELQKTGTLSFIESSIVNNEGLEALLSSGAAVEDTRLKSVLESLSPGLKPTGI